MVRYFSKTDEVEFHCDSCGVVVIIPGPLLAAFFAFMLAGWKIEADGDDFEHFCPECAAGISTF